MRRHITTLAIVAGTLAPLAVTTAAHAAPVDELSGTYTNAPLAAGSTWRTYDISDLHAISPSGIAPGHVVTYTATVDANEYAANWTGGGAAHLEAIGLLRLVDGEDPTNGTTLWAPTHDDDPIVFGQHNSVGTGVCANDQFYVNGVWSFGTGPNYQCGLPRDNSAQTATVSTGSLRYTISLGSDGTWTGTLRALDVDGDVVTSFSSTTPNWSSFAGDVGDVDAVFAPMRRLLASGDSMGNGIAGDPATAQLQFDVAFDALAPFVEAEVVGVELVDGTYVMTVRITNSGEVAGVADLLVDGEPVDGGVVEPGEELLVEIPVDASSDVLVEVLNGSVGVLDEVVTVPAAPAPTASPTPTADPTTSASASATTSAAARPSLDTLPATGGRSLDVVPVGVGLLAIGGLLLVLARERHTRGRHQP